MIEDTTEETQVEAPPKGAFRFTPSLEPGKLNRHERRRMMKFSGIPVEARRGAGLRYQKAKKLKISEANPLEV